MKKIFSAEPDGNEGADLEPARYFNLAKEEITENITWLKKTKEPWQAVLVHVDILVYLSKKYPDIVTDVISAAEVAEWKTIFDAWHERCKAKIPAQFRDGIKKSGDDLFKALEAYF